MARSSLTQAGQSALWDLGFILSYAALGLLVPYINGAVLDLLTHYGLLHGSFHNNAFIAAITEPWTSKLFGVAFFVLMGFGAAVTLALSVLMMIVSAVLDLGAFATIGLTAGVPLFTALFLHVNYDFQFKSVNLLRKRWKAAPMAGFIFGIQELYYRMLPEFTWLFWENPNFHPNILAPVALHIITGTLVVGAFLSSVSARSRMTGLFTLGAIVCASGLHFVWNTWLIATNEFWSSFYFGGSTVMFTIIFLGIFGMTLAVLRDVATALMYLSRS